MGITKLSEVKLLLQNIVIQEALLAMQKAHAGFQRFLMKTAALEAFSDVVQSPKSSTPYLVAFDALRVLPHLTLGQFQVMALTLLLQYLRNLIPMDVFISNIMWKKIYRTIYFDLPS